MSLALGDSELCVGGAFDRMGSEPRHGLAEFDLATGGLEPWRAIPGRNSGINAVAVDHGRAFAGGAFVLDSLTTVNRVAEFSPHSGLGGWTGDADEPIWALAAAQGMRAVGGGFHTFAGIASPALAYVSPPAEASGRPAAVPAPLVLLGSLAPNPTRDVGTLDYVLTRPAVVALDLSGLQGRRVSIVLSPTAQAAGAHQVRLPLAGLRSGCYFARVDADGSRATSTLVVPR